MSYTKEQLFKKLEACEDKLPTDEVAADEIEEGMKLHIKQLDGDRLDCWQRLLQEITADPTKEGKYGSLSRLIVALSLTDQGGTFCFDPVKFNTHAVLGKMPAPVRERVANAAFDLSYLSTRSQKELAKNSESDPEKGSGPI